MAGSTRRFGARYGRRVREKFDKVETARKEKQKCPFCHKIGVKRISAGIWNCPKCKSKFAGAAYTVERRTLTRAAEEEKEEEKPEIKAEAKNG